MTACYPNHTWPLATPKAFLELVKCGCRESCTTLSCSCRKHSESNCENRSAEDVTVETVESDDEDLAEEKVVVVHV